MALYILNPRFMTQSTILKRLVSSVLSSVLLSVLSILFIIRRRLDKLILVFVRYSNIRIICRCIKKTEVGRLYWSSLVMNWVGAAGAAEGGIE